jgi:poly-beta-1,6-N-acetyl-D-glucosamine synthase
MILPDSLQLFFNHFYLIYGLTLFLIYIGIALLSTYELRSYINRNAHYSYESIPGYQVIPDISIIAPCYNEEKSIVENIRSLSLLKYPNIELIIVNDGSTDESLDYAIKSYNLVEVPLAYEEKIKTAAVRGVYKSKNKAYPNLILVDKENGGKADALNAGINVSKSDLFLAIDVDCIIEQDAIMKMVKPFLEESSKKVIASGGVIRVANSCDIENGQLAKVRYPKNLWAKFQVLEYFRAFTLGRMAWSRINGLLIISGAFGMFDRKIAMEVGGYDTSSVGEDLELVVRMRKHMHHNKISKYKVAFIPDPLCWTEVPGKLKVLSRQRNRWTRGSVDTVIKHKNMFFNPKYGKIGMISFPYWIFFEWLAPVIEFTGLLYFSYMIFFSLLNVQVFLILMVMIYTFSIAFSFLAIFFETYLYNKYKGILFIGKAMLTSLLEMLIYHPLNIIFAISGNYQFFFKKDKKNWGTMTRTGFNPKTPEE